MDRTALVAEDMETGRKVVTAIKDRMPLNAAFWYYFPDAEEWRLVIATPLVDNDGRRAAYSRIQKPIKGAGLTDTFPVYRISAMSPDDPLIRLMRTAVRTGPGLSGIRFTGNVVNNVLVEDAYIYLLR